MNHFIFDVKSNKETKALELVKIIDFNYHCSLLEDGKKQFNELFGREKARFMYATLYVKYMNNNADNKDVEKMNLFENEFGLEKADAFNGTSLAGVNKELESLLWATLYAHGYIYDGIDYDINAETQYSISKTPVTFDMAKFYSVAKQTIEQIEIGDMSLEDGVKIVKSLYNDCTTILNHKAVDSLCKAWTESTKEKNTRLFLTGLFSSYKATKSNRLKKDSPLKSAITFEKYVLTWLVTGGIIATSKAKKEPVKVADIIKRQSN